MLAMKLEHSTRLLTAAREHTGLTILLPYYIIVISVQMS